MERCWWLLAVGGSRWLLALHDWRLFAGASWLPLRDWRFVGFVFRVFIVV
jgi:hypothetical protein